MESVNDLVEQINSSPALGFSLLFCYWVYFVVEFLKDKLI